MQRLNGPSTSQIKPNSYTVKEKAKFSPISGYCPTGCGLVQLTIYKTCPKCGAAFKRQQTWDSAVKRFNELCEENRSILDNNSFTDVKLPVMIGRQFYSVPFSFLVEFDNILNHEKHESFFIKLISECKILKN